MAVTESGLADLQGKVMNCGGGGSCGTCIVEVLDRRHVLFSLPCLATSRVVIIMTLKCLQLNLFLKKWLQLRMDIVSCNWIKPRLGIVNLQILDGKELLNERTNTENRYLKKVGSVQFTQLRCASTVLLVLESVRSTPLVFYMQMSCQLTVCLWQKPESWRLACQTIVGNKENSGKACFFNPYHFCTELCLIVFGCLPFTINQKRWMCYRYWTYSFATTQLNKYAKQNWDHLFMFKSATHNIMHRFSMKYLTICTVLCL